MQRLFLDANVLISVVNMEYPLFSYAARILSLATNPYFEVYTSPLCLAITFYFAEKKHGTPLAKKKIAIISEHIKIAPNYADGVQKTFENRKINDFEDGLEYYAAVDCNCDIIITEDVSDFYFSELKVFDCKRFFEQHLNKN
jgi:predicted nucleic acid-binding protein